MFFHSVESGWAMLAASVIKQAEEDIDSKVKSERPNPSEGRMLDFYQDVVESFLNMIPGPRMTIDNIIATWSKQNRNA